jgi:hypothetical protein
VKSPKLLALVAIPIVAALVWLMLPDAASKRRADAESSVPESASSASGWSPASARPTSGLHYDRKKAAELRVAILAALQADAQPPPVATNAPPSAPKTPQKQLEGPAAGASEQTMSPYAKSIQSRMREDLLPMAESCYKNLLAKRPDAGGKIQLEFEIIHDDKLGGVVNEGALGDAGTLVDDELTTCITESLSGVYFEAPPGKGKVTVKYPLTLSPDEPDAD